MRVCLEISIAVLHDTTGNFDLYIRADGGTIHVLASADLPNGTVDWYHLAGTIDRDGNATLYTNGYATATADVSGVAFANMNFTENLNILHSPMDGAGQPNQQADGLIDDFRIFSRLLSQAEITALYNSGSGTESSSPGAVAGADMYVQSSNQLYNTSADESYSWVYMAGNDTNVVTNIQYRTSLDGGVTWLDNTLEPSGIITSGTFTNSIFFAVTNFPSSGTNLMYEFNTINDDGGGVVRDVAIGRK